VKPKNKERIQTRNTRGDNVDQNKRERERENPNPKNHGDPENMDQEKEEKEEESKTLNKWEPSSHWWT
jgi:hypothetical protein